MAGLDLASIVAILATGGIFAGVLKMIFGKRNKSDVFDFERDYAGAVNKPAYQGEKPTEEAVFIGTANRKNVFIPSDP